MKVIEDKSPQGTGKWQMARLGCVTASKFGLVMAEPRSKSAVWTDGAETYARELAAERLSGVPLRVSTAAATEWGHDHEDKARATYQFAKAVTVEPLGFCRFEDRRIGASPDGRTVDGDAVGGHEIKSPYTQQVQVATWLDGMPRGHTPQVQGAMWVMGWPWVDFVSFDPRMPENRKLYVERVERDDAYIEKLSKRVEAFDRYVESIVEKLK